MKQPLPLPSSENSYYDENSKFYLDPELIFVFGSNEAGRHGAGAALYARLAMGAKYGIGFGVTGRCFAIPTKDKRLRVLDISAICRYVTEFKTYVTNNPNLSFYITPIGTGYAGYSHSEIAPLFKGIKNSWLPMAWKPYIDSNNT